MRTKRTIAHWTAGAAIACLILTACGKSSGATSPTTSGPAGQPQVNAKQLAKIRTCLKAAGIDLPASFGSGRPSGVPSGLPSGLPSFDPNQPPPSGFPGGGGGTSNDPKVQQALAACGIPLPTFTPNSG